MFKALQHKEFLFLPLAGKKVEKQGGIKMRLSKEEYAAIAEGLKTMREIFWDSFLVVNGKFPKNDKTMRSFWDLERSLSRTYYQMEREFFRDYPEARQSEYRGDEKHDNATSVL